MPCYTPLSAFRTRNGITFHQNDDESLYEIKLPCGICIGCRLEYARQWAVRITHEASLHDNNCFLTLTFDNEHLNTKLSLDKSDHQNFMKRLRKKYPRKKHGRISYFVCGEYGEKLSRPHYHSALFNFDFPDKLRIEDSQSGEKQYESQILNDLWGMGRATIGSLTPASAAYVAGYCTKKVRANLDPNYYGDRLPEFTSCSRRPAVGLLWIEKYHSDIYNYDTCMVQGKTQRPPRYYDKFYEKQYPDMMLDIKSTREYNSSLVNIDEQTEERLNVKHKIAIKNQEAFGSRNLNMGNSTSNGLPDSQRLYDNRVIKYREETTRQ